MRTVGLPCRVLLLVSLAATAQLAEAQTGSSRPYAGLFSAPTSGPDAPADSPLGAATGAAQPSSESTAPSAQAPGPYAPAVVQAGFPRRRPLQGTMLSMYGGLVALHTLDAHSTLRALDAGHAEANPVMRWVTSRPAAFVAVKAASTALTVYCAEKIREKHPKRAALFVAAVNAAYAAIVFQNYRVGGR